jgi:hypothetical protein
MRSPPTAHCIANTVLKELSAMSRTKFLTTPSATACMLTVNRTGQDKIRLGRED